MALLDRLRERNLYEQNRIRGLFPEAKPTLRTTSLLSGPTTMSPEYEYSTKRYHKAIPDPRIPESGSHRRDVAAIYFRLKKYHHYEKQALEDTDMNRNDFLDKTAKVMYRQYKAYFNNFMLSGEDIRHLNTNPEHLHTKVFRPLFNRYYKDVAIPVFMSGQDLLPRNNLAHMFVILRHGDNIEIYDSSAFMPSQYAPSFAMGFNKLITALQTVFNGDIETNNHAFNIVGNCDRISCVRAHHKELTMNEFNQRFVVPNLHYHTLDNINKEFMNAGIAENVLLSSIKTYEPEAAREERAMMAQEDKLATTLREVQRRERAMMAQEDRRV